MLETSGIGKNEKSPLHSLFPHFIQKLNQSHVIYDVYLQNCQVCSNSDHYSQNTGDFAHQTSTEHALFKLLLFLNHVADQGNKKFELFSQGTYNFQNFRNETLFIANYENVKKSAFDRLAEKLWLKESIILCVHC